MYNQMPRSKTGQQQMPPPTGASNMPNMSNGQQAMQNWASSPPQQQQTTGQPSQQPQMGTYTQMIPNSPYLPTAQQYGGMYQNQMSQRPQQGYMGDLMRQQASSANIGLQRALSPALQQMNSAYQDASAQEGLANQSFLLNRLGSNLGFQARDNNFILSQLMRLFLGG